LAELIKLPQEVMALYRAQQALLKSGYGPESLKFTLDGRLVGDIAEQRRRRRSTWSSARNEHPAWMLTRGANAG
jgi:hypothetical protein